MSRRRQERVTELIQQEVSKRIPFLKDPGIGFITIVAVRITPDFQQAKIYYSVIGDALERERTQAALDRARSFLRGELRSLESLKFPPELTFLLDTSAEDAQKVFTLLNDLEKERKDNPPLQDPPVQ